MFYRDEEGLGALEGAGFECFIPNIGVYVYETIMFEIFILINKMNLSIPSFVGGINA